MEDSKHWGSPGQRASTVQERTRKLAEANSGEKQMSCLNMKPESESLYRGGFVFIHLPLYHSFLGFLIFVWLSPTSWMTTWWGSCRDNVSLLVENEDPLKTGNAMKLCSLVYSSTSVVSIGKYFFPHFFGRLHPCCIQQKNSCLLVHWNFGKFFDLN